MHKTELSLGVSEFSKKRARPREAEPALAPRASSRKMNLGLRRVKRHRILPHDFFRST
jgi:hypothetical protein